MMKIDPIVYDTTFDSPYKLFVKLTTADFPEGLVCEFSTDADAVYTFEPIVENLGRKTRFPFIAEFYDTSLLDLLRKCGSVTIELLSELPVPVEGGVEL